MIKQLVILSLCCIVAQVVDSAPSGACVELCNSERASASNDFASQTAGLSTFQTHAALQNLQQAINNRLRDPQMSLDYTRPGNWSEHNQWATDGGAGKVHEERGQLEAGNAKVQYYKKNYTASFGSGNLNNPINNFINTRNNYNNNLLSQQQQQQQQRQVEDFRGSVDIASELESRLHQLQTQMDQFNSNIHEYSLPITTTSSFETHMSQLKTRVDQINNQIHQNSQQSRYSNANQSPQAQQHLQQLIQSYESRMLELQNMLNQITRQANRVSHHQQQQQQQQYSNERILVPETTTNTQQQNHHYEYKSHHEQQQINTHSGYVPTSQSYVIPSDNLQQITETQQQQQTYVPTSSQSQSQYHHGNQNIIRVPIHQGNHYQNYREEEIGHELETANDSLQQQQQQQQHNVYVKNVGKHVEEHWSASGHRSESTIPYQHQQQVANDNFERIRQQQHQSGGSSSSSRYQQSGGGQFRTGVIDVGQTTADCDTETQSQYKSSPYHQRRYRRGIRDGNLQQTEDLTQQTEDLSQQTEDLTQQTFDNYNQHEHDVNRHQVAEDLSSQRGQLEPGNQRHHESPYDRYGQHNTENHNRHNHNDQDYYNRHNHHHHHHHQESQQGFGDHYTQQQQQQYQSQDLTQQSETVLGDYPQQGNSNQDAQSVVGIEGQGAKWHTQHNSGDLTNNNYQHQQHSGTTGYGNNQEGGTFESGYPGDVVASTTNKPGFWKGVSNKISRTYEKAKNKVSDVLG